MTLEELATEYVQALPGLILDEEQATMKAVEAARFYAGYGDIKSLSQSDTLPRAPGAGAPYPEPADPEPVPRSALPIKAIDMIGEDTDVSLSEWAIIRPLFVLYVERGNATLLEASRGLGVDVFGRAVSEVAQDITRMEEETLPAKAFMQTVETIGGDINPQQIPGGWGFYPGSWNGG